MTRTIAMLALGCLLLPLEASAQSANSAATGPKFVLKLGTTAVTAGEWPVMVGLDKGFFKNHGVDIQHVTSQNASNNMQALLAGSLQLASSSPDSVILPIEHGANLAAVAGVASLFVGRIVAAKNISSLAQLRGRTLAVSRLNGPDTAIMRQVLAKVGLQASNYTMLTTGGSAQRLAAVVSGGAAATLLAPPEDYKAVLAGLSDLGLSTDMAPPLQFVTWFADRNWAQNNSTALVAAIKGLVDALTWLHDPANKAEAVDIIKKHMNLNDAAAKSTYEIYLERSTAFPQKAEINREGFKNVMEYLADFGDLSRPLPALNKYIDAKYIEQASK